MKFEGVHLHHITNVIALLVDHYGEKRTQGKPNEYHLAPRHVKCQCAMYVIYNHCPKKCVDMRGLILTSVRLQAIAFN